MDAKSNCPCCNSCCVNNEDFTRVANFNNLDLNIYQYPTNANDLSVDKGKYDNDVFIIENNKLNDVHPRVDIINPRGYSNIICPKCIKVSECIQRLLAKIPVIEKNALIGVCNHCQLNILKTNCRCEEAIKKFNSMKNTIKSEDRKLLTNKWLANMANIAGILNVSNKTHQVLQDGKDQHGIDQEIGSRLKRDYDATNRDIGKHTIFSKSNEYENNSKTYSRNDFDGKNYSVPGYKSENKSVWNPSLSLDANLIERPESIKRRKLTSRSAEGLRSKLLNNNFQSEDKLMWNSNDPKSKIISKRAYIDERINILNKVNEQKQHDFILPVYEGLDISMFDKDSSEHTVNIHALKYLGNKMNQTKEKQRKPVSDTERNLRRIRFSQSNDNKSLSIDQSEPSKEIIANYKSGADDTKVAPTSTDYKQNEKSHGKRILQSSEKPDQIEDSYFDIIDKDITKKSKDFSFRTSTQDTKESTSLASKQYEKSNAHQILQSTEKPGQIHIKDSSFDVIDKVDTKKSKDFSFKTGIQDAKEATSVASKQYEKTNAKQILLSKVQPDQINIKESSYDITDKVVSRKGKYIKTGSQNTKEATPTESKQNEMSKAKQIQSTGKPDQVYNKDASFDIIEKVSSKKGKDFSFVFPKTIKAKIQTKAQISSSDLIGDLKDRLKAKEEEKKKVLEDKRRKKEEIKKKKDEENIKKQLEKEKLQEENLQKDQDLKGFKKVKSKLQEEHLQKDQDLKGFQKDKTKLQEEQLQKDQDLKGFQKDKTKLLENVNYKQDNNEHAKFKNLKYKSNEKEKQEPGDKKSKVEKSDEGSDLRHKDIKDPKPSTNYKENYSKVKSKSEKDTLNSEDLKPSTDHKENYNKIKSKSEKETSNSKDLKPATNYKENDSKIKSKLEKQTIKSEDESKELDKIRKKEELIKLKEERNEEKQKKVSDREEKTKEKEIEKREKELTKNKIENEVKVGNKALPENKLETKAQKEPKSQKEPKVDQSIKDQKEDKTKKKYDNLAQQKLEQELARQAKQQENDIKSKKQQDDAEQKAREAADKKAKEQAALSLKEMKQTKPESKGEPVLANESTRPLTKDLHIKEIKVSSDDLILRLAKQRNKDTLFRRGLNANEVDTLLKRKNDRRKSKTMATATTASSDLDLELHKSKSTNEKVEIIKGEKIFKLNNAQLNKKTLQNEGLPVIIKSDLNELYSLKKVEQGDLQETIVDKPLGGAGKLQKANVEPEVTQGVMRYALSDRTYIDKGWTMLPTEKVVRKMNVYKMLPAHPEFDWFAHNKGKGRQLMQYDSGDKQAEIDDDGRGRWYYRNGRLALDYYDAEEVNAGQRFVVYSSGENDERGRSQPITVLAMFDYLGNGVVFDHKGKIRLKYNQTEGVLLDRSIGPVSHWKWHTLNDPPVLQRVMIDTHAPLKDPHIAKLGTPSDDQPRPDNEDMLAIEFDNFIKEKSKKLTQKFKPFQIKMKALKINENFSLRVLDQATVYLIFRDGTTSMKMNIGMVLNHQEIVDTDTAEVGDVTSGVERFPAKTDSLAAMQKTVANAQRTDHMLTEHERRIRPIQLAASLDRMRSAISRPLRHPFRTVPYTPTSQATTSAASGDYCSSKSRKRSSTDVYYNTRLF